ncbi:liprin-beta-1-like isoform X2 [Montipora foliosa]
MAAVASDAATMLAEALEKMDGLISDDQLIMESFKSQPRPISMDEKVLSLVEELRAQVEQLSNDAKSIDVPESSIIFLIDWLMSVQKTPDGERTKSELPTAGDSHVSVIGRLEAEKESMLLQVSVLTDQVEAQGEKIRDLEFTKEELQIKLEDAEQLLENETVKTANLLNEKLELVTEISSLKLALSKKTGFDLEGNKEYYENLLAEKDSEIEMLKDHIEVLLDEQETFNKSHHTEGQPSTALKAQLREKASEVNTLNIKVEALTASCKEKDQQIQETQQSLLKLKRIEEMLIKANQRKISDDSPVVSLDGMDSSSIHSTDLITSPSSTSSPEPYPRVPNHSRPPLTESYSQAVSNPVTPSLQALKRKSPPASPSIKKKHGIRSSFGKGLLKLRRNKSSSEPNIAGTERDENKSPEIKDSPSDKENTPPAKSEYEKKKNSSKFGKAFTKLRRTRSLGTTPSDHPTTMEALHGQRSTNHRDYGDQLELPFNQWSRQMVLSWLADLGLGQYSSQCGKVVTCGQDLLKASPHHLEKDMGFKNPLHRKKLVLALQALVSDGPDVMGRLSNQWVLGWLEDIGLPQYKDAFSEGSVDGRMLNYLTFSDMLYLKVHNAFHHIAIKRAIQCLRLHNFHPNCLKRHPVDESWLKGADVLLWTNGRVTEWLRLVDLAEYAPNLRGSGVHGALMILDPRFTAESLAALLSIPNSKTLLRRHLATHFQSLIGAECHQMKEKAAGDPTFQPLMPGIKHKAVKRSPSLAGMRKRGKGNMEPDDYVCPMDLEVPSSLQSYVMQRSRRSSESLRSRLKSDEEGTLQSDNRVTGTIGAFSQELDSLTHMLKKERNNARDGLI